jgi:hypothetical protein
MEGTVATQYATINEHYNAVSRADSARKDCGPQAFHLCAPRPITH